MLHRLVRLIWEHRPDIVAVDNIYELGDEKEVAKFASLLPESTSIVQVTLLDDGTPVSVRTLAAEAGIEVHGKLSPSRTAYVLALLASKGYGVKLRFLEEKTKIIVSRSRSPGKGGSSSSRYQRSLRASVLRAVKDIKRVLDREGLDYDLVFRKSGGGLDSAVFIVYAPREKLYGLVKPRDDGKVRVEVKPVYSSHIMLETGKIDRTATGRKYLIVGVDPGPSTGIAAVDLNGRLVFVMSKRGLDRQEAIEIILKHGVPLVVATDVKPVPEYVKRLAAALGAAVYEPPESLSVEEKREIAQRYAEGVKLDPHERDALAAAIKAYNYYSDKLRQIESTVSKYGVEIDVKRVAASVIKGVSIAEAVEREIAELIYNEKEPGLLLKRVRHGGENGGQEAELAQTVERLRKEIERLEAERKLLEERIRELKALLEERESELRSVRLELRASVEVERKVQQLKHELEIVKNELERVREDNRVLRETVERYSRALVAAATANVIPVVSFRSLTKSSLKLIQDLRPRIVRIEDASSAPKEVVEQLTKLGVRVVVTGDERLSSALKVYKVLTVPDDVTVEVLGDTALIDASKLSSYMVEEYSRMSLTGEKKGLDLTKLKKMLEEYRAMRAAELRKSDEGEELEYG